MASASKPGDRIVGSHTKAWCATEADRQSFFSLIHSSRRWRHVRPYRFTGLQPWRRRHGRRKLATITTYTASSYVSVCLHWIYDYMNALRTTSHSCSSRLQSFLEYTWSVCHAMTATSVFVRYVRQWHKGAINFSAHLTMLELAITKGVCLSGVVFSNTTYQWRY